MNSLCGKAWRLTWLASVLCVVGKAYLLTDEHMITTTVGPRQQQETKTYQLLSIDKPG